MKAPLTSDQRRTVLIDVKALVGRIDPGKAHWPLILSTGSMLDTELLAFREFLIAADARIS